MTSWRLNQGILIMSSHFNEVEAFLYSWKGTGIHTPYSTINHIPLRGKRWRQASHRPCIFILKVLSLLQVAELVVELPHLNPCKLGLTCVTNETHQNSNRVCWGVAFEYPNMSTYKHLTAWLKEYANFTAYISNQCTFSSNYFDWPVIWFVDLKLINSHLKGDNNPWCCSTALWWRN